MVVHQLVELGVAGSNPVGHPFDRLRVYDPRQYGVVRVYSSLR